jgi:hypothetical protein
VMVGVAAGSIASASFPAGQNSMEGFLERIVRHWWEEPW